MEMMAQENSELRAMLTQTQQADTHASTTSMPAACPPQDGLSAPCNTAPQTTLFASGAITLPAMPNAPTSALPSAPPADDDTSGHNTVSLTADDEQMAL